MEKPKNYFLLHGAWHASWCWKYVAQLLTAQGHRVYTPDLPGHGNNQTPFTTIHLATYVEFISDLIAQQNQPIILVGHSLAGVIISQVAENAPEKIAKLVYVAAFIPPHNGSLLQEAKKSTLNNLTNQMRIDTSKNQIELIISDQLKKIFYNACNETDANDALARLQPEPFKPFVEPISISPEKFGTVDKTYIECRKDRIISLEDQQRMHRKIHCTVATLEADHSPFLSTPQELATLLSDINLKQ